MKIPSDEFYLQFPNERAARLHLEHRRWPEAVTCPHCGNSHIQTRKVDGYYRCLTCKTDFTVRTGTIFERSHVPLDKWLYAIYVLVTAHTSVSSAQLSKDIQVTQKTAGLMRCRILAACGASKNHRAADSSGATP